MRGYRAGRFRLSIDDIVKRVGNLGPAKRLPLAEHFVHHNPQAINIRPFVDHPTASNLLG